MAQQMLKALFVSFTQKSCLLDTAKNIAIFFCDSTKWHRRSQTIRVIFCLNQLMSLVLSLIFVEVCKMCERLRRSSSSMFCWRDKFSVQRQVILWPVNCVKTEFSLFFWGFIFPSCLFSEIEVTKRISNENERRRFLGVWIRFISLESRFSHWKMC